MERVLKMADGCLLLVDAFEGPMPQTTFVLRKAFEIGLRPIVVINKIDRPDARPADVHNEVFDLFIDLGADEEALEFPTIYASATEGYATLDPDARPDNIFALFDTILDHVPTPDVDPAAPLQMLITTIDYNDYVGRIGIGRVFAGTIHAGRGVTVIHRDGTQAREKIGELFVFDGLGRQKVDRVPAGDLCAVVGLDSVDIGNTIADPDDPRPLPIVHIDEPTLHMTFRVNDSPFTGPGGQVSDQQSSSRSAGQGSAAKRGPAGGAGADAGGVSRFRAGCAAPVRADREHAPGGLRTGGREAEGHLSRTRRQEDRAD